MLALTSDCLFVGFWASFDGFFCNPLWSYRVFREFLLEDLKANEQKMRDYVENSVGIITAVNPHIGYEASTEIAKKAIETGKPLRELLINAKLLTEKEIDLILDPMEMTKPGIAAQALLDAKKKK